MLDHDKRLLAQRLASQENNPFGKETSSLNLGDLQGNFNLSTLKSVLVSDEFRNRLTESLASHASGGISSNQSGFLDNKSMIANPYGNLPSEVIGSGKKRSPLGMEEEEVIREEINEEANTPGAVSNHLIEASQAEEIEENIVTNDTPSQTIRELSLIHI
eukprot:TRINITY_DN33537_c0_g1_i1.p1 TRINITY_DN33537_c0_g1~~TRINITY_DN33537_c0_g1_i1.p1  ORF type:complete len:160 (+),score=33.99 TRINITY_DN33537_c0_g1_i1:1-480(+)